ncbi:MAG: FAD-dependent oxidoreductase, partial [Lachnospiraceae bacterium]|nr:FAD-dependent oxidoreductase [Lachnospiraceae bacterium]
ATQTSVAVYSAMVDAIKQAGGDVDALTKSIEYEAPAEAVVECEVVVVGAGGAGLLAAIELQNAGVDVILIEKEGIFGGTTLTASTYVYGYGTSVHEKAGIKMTAQQYYDGLVNLAFPRLVATAPDMAMKYAEIVPPTLENYMTYGADLTNLIDGMFEMGPADGSTVGGTLVPALIAEAERLGVDMRANTKAVSLIQKDNAVTGVVVDTKGGQYEIHADAVIMATGGFQQNKDMVAQYLPEYANYGTTYSVGSTGEGMQMCEEVGGYLNAMNIVQINPTGFRVENADNLISFSNFRYYGCILVGRSTGTRFANELGDYTAIASAMPEGKAYAIFDEAVFQSSGAIQEYYDLGYIVKADTLEELAGKLELDVETLKDTMAKYAATATAGVDEEFGRNLFPSDLTTAPYYAAPVEPVLHNHTGGVATDARGQALAKADNSVIPGLYVVGTAADNTLQPMATFSFPYARLVVECVIEDLAK